MPWRTCQLEKSYPHTYTSTHWTHPHTIGSLPVPFLPAVKFSPSEGECMALPVPRRVECLWSVRRAVIVILWLNNWLTDWLADITQSHEIWCTILPSSSCDPCGRRCGIENKSWALSQFPRTITVLASICSTSKFQGFCKTLVFPGNSIIEKHTSLKLSSYFLIFFVDKDFSRNLCLSLLFFSSQGAA